MTDPATTAEKHLLGFALFGPAWLAFVIAGRVLLWIFTAILIAALAVGEAVKWVAGRFRTR